MSNAPGYGKGTFSVVYSGIAEGIMELDTRVQMTLEVYAGGILGHHGAGPAWKANWTLGQTRS